MPDKCGKVLQYCSWYSRYSHIQLRLGERAKGWLGITATICGPPGLVGHTAQAAICVLGRAWMCKDGSYVNAFINLSEKKGL